MDAPVAKHLFIEQLSKLPYFQSAPLPNIDADYHCFNLTSDEDVLALSERHGITAHRAIKDNHVFLHREAGKAKAKLKIAVASDFSGNTVIIDRDCGVSGEMNIFGPNNLAVFFGGQSHVGMLLTLTTSSTLIWGRRSFAFGVAIAVERDTVCTIGDDCLFSAGIWIRTTDHHSIIDLDSFEVLNPPRDVIFGQHVWVGQECLFLKGATIGDGCIIGARSLVNGVVPSYELWAGSPARVLKQNVSWVGSHPNPPKQELDALKAMIEGQPRVLIKR